jgi:hypothetical protein
MEDSAAATEAAALAIEKRRNGPDQMEWLLTTLTSLDRLSVPSVQTDDPRQKIGECK